MIKNAFNLKSFMKKAFYEGIQGYWSVNSRCWPNCQKAKMDGKDKSKHEAYMECLDEYNKWDKAKWAQTYGECNSDSGEPKIDRATPGTKGLQADKDKKSKKSKKSDKDK